MEGVSAQQMSTLCLTFSASLIAGWGPCDSFDQSTRAEVMYVASWLRQVSVSVPFPSLFPFCSNCGCHIIQVQLQRWWSDEQPGSLNTHVEQRSMLDKSCELELACSIKPPRIWGHLLWQLVLLYLTVSLLLLF